MTNQAFNERLKSLMFARRMTTLQLSRKTDISQTGINNMLSGMTKVPRLGNAEKLAKALGVSLEYILNGKQTQQDKEVFEVLEDDNLIDNMLNPPPILNTVPLLTAGGLAAADQRESTLYGQAFVVFPEEKSEKSIVAVTAVSNANAPDILAGDTVFIERFVDWGAEDAEEAREIEKQRRAEYVREGDFICVSVNLSPEKTFAVVGRKTTDINGCLWVTANQAEPNGTKSYKAKNFIGKIVAVYRSLA